MLFLYLLPVRQRFAQALWIDFHPLAPEKQQPLGAGEKLAPFFVGQRIAIQRQADLKIHQLVQSDRARALLADLDAHLRARRPPPRPPVLLAPDAAGLLYTLSLAREPIRHSPR